MQKINKIFSLIVIALLLFIQSCAATGSFSEEAYNKAVTLKVESLQLMGKATEEYSKHTDEINSLTYNLKIAYEYSKGRPDNEITTKQWEIMISPDRNLIGGFLNIWKDDQKLSAVFVDEAQKVISDAFDTIIGLESGKIKQSELPAGQSDNQEEK